MGGRAFLEMLPGATFPRMDPVMYHSLKAQHLEQLRRLFLFVSVSREAPEKESHGDIDYIVCSPVDKPPSSEDMKDALGAVHSIADGRSVNLAIPMEGGEGSAFYQVDINHAHDENEWERVIAFHSYGDLGMILGLMARANGLSLGLNGLKVFHSPQFNTARFVLSTSFPRIFEFFGLDLATWEAGFPSLQSSFQWAASSHFFDPYVIKESHREHRRTDRQMYQKFLSWVRDQWTEAPQNEETPPRATMRPRIDHVIEEALIFFGKKEEYDVLVESQRNPPSIRNKFNGNLVMQWTGLPQGRAVKALMDEVRKTHDDVTMQCLTLEEINALVLRTQARMTSMESFE